MIFEERLGEPMSTFLRNIVANKKIFIELKKPDKWIAEVDNENINSFC